MKGSDRTAYHSRSSHNVPNKSQTTPISYSYIARSRLSDRGEDAKVKGTRKVGGAGKSGKREGSVSSCFFLSSRFLNSADLTISQPGTR